MFGAIGSLVSALLGAGAQQNATNLGYAQLNETKRDNRFKQDLATSDQPDAYGDVLKYNKAAKRWEIDLTPLTQSILGAQQKEQLANLTEDAPRNRAAAVRQDRRSQQAADAFETAFNNYRYRPQKSKGAYEGEAVSRALNAQKSGIDQVASILARQALRTGNSGDYASIFKQAADSYANSLAGAIARGKAAGDQSYNSDRSADNANAQQELNFYRGVADDTQNTPVQDPSIGNNLTSQGQSALNRLIQTVSGNQSALSSAYGNLESIVGRSPSINLSGLDSLLGGFKSSAVPTANDPRAPIPAPYSDAILARQRAGTF